MNTRTALAAFALTALVAPLGAIAPAHASHGGGGGVRNSGSCSKGAHWKLKAKHDDGRIEVEGEIDSNRSGQVWHWAMRHNGSVSAKGKATTHGASGSFSVQRRMSNLAGTDHFVFRAERAATGEVCRGRVSL
ncbi:MAG: hypothetical protein J2P22_03815 [Nocardioides sp.]|nr:hypothetical protein [Nocardioides sp.]